MFSGFHLINKISYWVLTIVLFAAIANTFERPVYAYVDPGSSLLIFQGVSAVVTGAVFYFRRRLKALITKLRASKTTPQAGPR